MWCAVTLIFYVISFIETKSIPENNTAILISKYAKVTHWGVNENGTKSDHFPRRSGQSLWNHRTVSLQDVNSEKPKVIYHHAVYKKQPSRADDKIEKLPAVGEVIQDRYNPRPYFGYGKIPPKSEESATYSAPKPVAPSTSGYNIDSFPSSTSKSVDLYTSPYSSYNPPPVMPESSPITDQYPPSNQDTYDTLPNFGDEVYHKEPQGHQSPPYASLGPPLSPEYMPPAGQDSMTSNKHNDYNLDTQLSDYDSRPPNYPPKSEDDIYYPPDVSNGGNDHSGKGLMPAQDMNMDMPPPDQHGRFPQYLYDSHHFDNHIYEEIPHTTTEATEDKRVSGGQYSYYYLGRKLWYVPLYFSIYFIIYVTVLILKAIARHKIQYKQKWVTHVRGSRKLNDDEYEYIENVTRNVTNAVENAKKYTFAM